MERAELEQVESQLGTQRCVLEIRKRIDFKLDAIPVDLANIAFGSSFNASSMSSHWRLRECSAPRRAVGNAAHLMSNYREDSIFTYYLVRLANGDELDAFVPKAARNSTFLRYNGKRYAEVEEIPVGSGWAKWFKWQRRWNISLAEEPLGKVECGVHVTPKSAYEIEVENDALGQENLPFQAGVVIFNRPSRRVIPESSPEHASPQLKLLHFHVAMVFRLCIFGLY